MTLKSMVRYNHEEFFFSICELIEESNYIINMGIGFFYRFYILYLSSLLLSGWSCRMRQALCCIQSTADTTSVILSSFLYLNNKYLSILYRSFICSLISLVKASMFWYFLGSTTDMKLGGTVLIYQPN